MANLLLTALYFFLPAYIANMAPVLCKWLPFLDKPIWEQKLGRNKTWRGVIVGTLVGGLTFWIQKILFMQGFTSWALIDYADFSVLLGFLLGFGALFGDAVKSYYKRKAEIKEGKRWIPFDQLDFVLGGIIFSWFIYVPPIEIIALLLIISPLLHFLFSFLGYLLKLKKNW